MQLLTSIAPLAPEADVWFLDIWGVLHNGHKPFAGAVDACQAFRQGGGHVVLVSNSPRPRPGVVKQLDDIGVARDAYDDVITSGDVSRALIGQAAGTPLLHIGPKRDLPLFDGLDATFADVSVAGVAVCSGLYDDETETPADYAALLTALLARDVPMICANPDIKAERGGKLIYCAGAIAEAYEKLGGEVQYAGKPHAPIYTSALAIAGRLTGGDVAQSRVLAIGDGVATDIRGASAAGIRSVFVASGVHVARGVSVTDAADALFASESMKPIGLMTALVW
ncbi:MAG: TIGR01459 family HAD-type hydrolase [Hyphomicrobium sp.]|nr:TIGR01459 family HAD-type hydrolase [Hyphomicrobium sp.]